MQTLVALYHSFDKAQKAVEELVRNGISRDSISIVASDATGEFAKEYSPLATNADDAVTAGQGAAFGAASGGIMGVLAGLGVLALPGIGPVLAAGPLVAALTGGIVGAAAGASTGGIVAALVHTNKITQDEAEIYAEGVRRGDTLLSVEAEDNVVMKVREVLDRYNPVDIRTRAEEFRSTGWKAFDTNAQPYDADAIKSYRQHFENRLPLAADTDNGTKTYSPFDSYDSDFRTNYLEYYVNSGRGYDQYGPVYRYGYEVATSPLYRDSAWESIESNLRQDWDKQNPETPWDDFKDAVHYAWDRIRGVKQPV
jgi:hypothetical protein